MSEPPTEDERPSHRLDGPAINTVATVALVVALVLGAVAVLVWSERGDDADPGPVAATTTPRTDTATSAPTPTPTPTPTEPTRTPKPKPKPKPEPRKPPKPPESILPTLGETDEQLGSRGLARVPAREVESLSFVVSSFNVLGASHTRGPGARRGFGSAEARLGAQIGLLDAKGVSVAGLQEFQGPQVNALRGRTGDEWGVYPGLQLGELAADNSIIWRNAEWSLIQAEVSQIPYFGGRPRQMPHVLLEHRETGRRVWFGNYHNPANVGGNQAGNRARALSIEASLSRQLSADGTPVVITGDMNDRGEFACPFASQSGMVSADGARDDGGGCVTPSRMNVDWIWGTRDLTWSGFLTDFSTENRKLSDHPMITSTANLTGAIDRDGCTSRITTKGVFWYCPDGG